MALKVRFTFVLLLIQFLFPLVSFAGQFEYSIYDRLLRRYVSDGEIDYLEWKKRDFGEFERYIKSLKQVSTSNMSEEEKKAFWINAYNALTIYGVLQHIPNSAFLARVFSVRMIPGFFDTIKYEVGGELVTLDDIENEKLRAGFKDPRIHFAIVCASMSCPKIQPWAFKADGLEQQLDESARLFIRDRTRNRLDPVRNVIYLSQIFKWFGQDFIDSAGSVIDYVKRYLKEEDARYLSNHHVRKRYLYYDWLINIKR